MERQSTQDVIDSDEETLQAWENMRTEVLHELQEGASAEVPDEELDNIGNLVVTLTSLRTQQKLRLPKALFKPDDKLTKSVN